MNCSAVYKYICEQLDEGLESPKCRDIHKHLKGCSECTARLKHLKSIIALYRLYPLPPLAPDVRDEFFRSLKHTKK